MNDRAWEKELRYIKKDVKEYPVNDIDLRDLTITFGKLYEAFKDLYRRDMVGVVRCENCEYWVPECRGSSEGTCSIGNVMDSDYEFCSRGLERGQNG